MGNLSGFNANEHHLGGTVVPDGWYPAIIGTGEFKKSSAGGQYISLVYSLIGTEHVNKKITEMFTWTHANPQAVNIGKAKFGSLCRAAGKPEPDDLSELLGKKVCLYLKVVENENFGKKSEVRKHEPIGKLKELREKEAAKLGSAPQADLFQDKDSEELHEMPSAAVGVGSAASQDDSDPF